MIEKSKGSSNSQKAIDELSRLRASDYFEKNEYSINNSITLQYYFKKSTSQYSTESNSYYRVYAIAFTTPDTEFKISSLRFVYRIANISTLDSASDIK